MKPGKNANYIPGSSMILLSRARSVTGFHHEHVSVVLNTTTRSCVDRTHDILTNYHAPEPFSFFFFFFGQKLEYEKKMNSLPFFPMTMTVCRRVKNPPYS